ncbi:tRNA methyltransferase 44 [Mortierella sp. GBA35]|nr:tRNA methyltransferase 44 [Mortierella sp. GBA35]
MKVNEPVVEHVYTPTFYFDDLPNNNKRHTLPQSRTTSSSNSPAASADTLPKEAQWYRAAVVPVAFNEDIFWQVLERWILEAPSIIPPISKVEVLHTTEKRKEKDEVDQDTSNDILEENYSTATTSNERESALLDGLVPFKTVRRQLIPKRVDKDPLMEEQLYYCRYTHVQDQDQEQEGERINPDSTDTPRVRNQAIFAPSINIAGGGGKDLDGSEEKDEIKMMTEALPFYYPKVRGFRYGYMFDPEEAPEDKDDDHHDCHQEDEEEEVKEEGSEKKEKGTEVPIESDGQDNKQQGGVQQTTGPNPNVPKKKKHAPKNRVISRRTGWLSLDLFLKGDEGEFTDKIQYAFKELFKKLYKWGNNATKGFTKSRVQHDVMVPKDLYLRTYARMKETHAQKWVQSWPEKTDPRKFVFEDIAIAAWLVALWELERETIATDTNSTTTTEGREDGGLQEGATETKTGTGGKSSVPRRKQTFVDLGCGNGLLTHILNEEGHKGTGIDIVSRKVWDIYGSNTSLQAETLIPNETAYEDVDWIIGNHADELAPWVPIIASRSKPLTRFVVIPCCFFDLNGSRYQFAEGAPDGKYKAYQGYISRVIKTCGYDLQTEILRIPSTKNVALVGMTKRRKRGDDEDEHDDEEEDREQTRRRVDELVARSGLFVARISDKEKQASQKAKQAAKLSKEDIQPPPSPENTINNSTDNKPL